ncbi:MAG: hypothetical protein SFT81_02360 [Candidatus Caenarcaniphilales bacterium]|nr:hypothetical protein [Candidatus Caenarcaniphilales bacterium]
MPLSPIQIFAPQGGSLTSQGVYASSGRLYSSASKLCGRGCSCPICFASTPTQLASYAAQPKALVQSPPPQSPNDDGVEASGDDPNWQKSGKYPLEAPRLSPEEIAELPYPLTPKGQKLPPTITDQVQPIELTNRNTPEYKDFLEAIPDVEQSSHKPGSKLIGFIDHRTNAYYLIENNTGQDIPIQKLVQMINKSDFLASQIQGVINHEFSHKNHMERYVKDDQIDKWYVSIVITIDGSPKEPQYGVATWGYSVVNPGLDEIIDQIDQGENEVAQRLPQELQQEQITFKGLLSRSPEEATQFLQGFKNYLTELGVTLQDWARRLPILKKEAGEIMTAAFTPLVLRGTELEGHADATISKEDLGSYDHGKELLGMVQQLVEMNSNLMKAVQQGLTMVQAQEQELVAAAPR